MKVTWLGYHFFMIFPTCFSEACVERQRKMICINEKQMRALREWWEIVHRT